MSEDVIAGQQSPEPPAANSSRMTASQFASILETHFSVLAVGLVTSNQRVPPHVMWSAIAEAMGNVLSGATQSSDIKSTVEARGRLGDIVNKAIRQRYPAISSVPMPPAAPQ